MEPRSQRAWFALAVLFAINTMNFYDRQIIASLTEPIRMEWALTDRQIGVLGTAFTLLYAAVGVPLGRLSDRAPRTRILSVGVAAWSLFTAASGAAWNYAAMFVLRLGVGVGEASCAPAANALVGDLFPPRQRARALSIMMLGLPVGIFCSSLFSGAIAASFGWRTAFYVACVPGLILAVLMRLVPEPPRGGVDPGSATSPSAAPICRPGSPYRIILGTPTMVWIIVTGALHNFNMYAVMTFLPAFVQRYHGLPLRVAATVSGVVMGAVGIVGLLAGGWAADRAQHGRSSGRLLVAAVCMALSVPCVFLGLERPPGDVAGFMILMGTGIMLMYVYYAGVYAAIQDVIEPGLRATAMAVYFFAMYVFGGSFGSYVTGALSDRFAARAMVASGLPADTTPIPESFRAIGLHEAMYVVPVLCAALAGALFAASRTVGRDMQRLKDWSSTAAAEAE